MTTPSGSYYGIDKATFAVICQWRLGFWQNCPEGFHRLAQVYFILETVLWTIEAFFLIIHIIYFTLSYDNKYLESQNKKKVYQFNKWSLIFVFIFAILQIIHFALGIDGKGGDAPNIILEILTAFPFWFGFLAGILIVLSWVELVKIYEKKFNKDKNKYLQVDKVGKGILIGVSVLTFVLSTVTCIISGVHPYWSPTSTQVNLGIWGFINFITTSYALFLGFNVLKIVKETEKVSLNSIEENPKQSQISINMMRAITIKVMLMIFVIGLGCGSYSFLCFFISFYYYDLQKDPSTAFAIFFLYYLVALFMIPTWQISFQIYHKYSQEASSPGTTLKNSKKPFEMNTNNKSSGALSEEI